LHFTINATQTRQPRHEISRTVKTEESRDQTNRLTHYRVMMKRSLRAYGLITGLLLQSNLVACSSDNGSESAESGSGGATTSLAELGGGTVVPQGGASATHINGTTTAGGNATAGNSTKTVVISATTGGTSTSASTEVTGGTHSLGGTSASGGTVEAGGNTSSGGAPSNGGTAASSGQSTTGGSIGTCAIPTPSNAPVGYGAAVTGGGNATPITAKNQQELVTALAAYKKGTTGLVINYTGTVDFSTIAANPCGQFTKDEQTVDIKEVSNVTIVGARGAAMNFGLHLSRVKNVIIRNLKIGLVPGGGDAIGIEGASSNIWIDHNELFSSMAECEGAGDKEFDGLLDIKDGSQNMTFSYNYFHDHHKVGLMGSSDSDVADWRVTIHHNRYENVGSRTPLQRGGTTHIFNNYYQTVVSGINVRMSGVALIESNYFENSENPVTSRDSSAIGYWDLRNNFVGNGIVWTKADDDPYVNATDWKTTKAFTPSLGYSYTPDSASCVKTIVTALAGAIL
jgi:pectate lyase